MGKLKVLGGAVAAATVAMLGATLVPASSQPVTSPPPPQTETITTCDRAREGFEKHIDLGKKGFSPGDFGVFTLPERDLQTGDKVGRVVGQFLLVKKMTRPRDGIILVNATAIFPQGKISFGSSGKFSGFQRGLTFPITGGTGRYSLARGTVHVKEGKCAGKEGAVVTMTVNLT